MVSEERILEWEYFCSCVLPLPRASGIKNRRTEDTSDEKKQ